MVIIAKYGFSTTIPELSCKSSSEVTTNAAALDEAISFLYLGKNANAIDLLEADFLRSDIIRYVNIYFESSAEAMKAKMLDKYFNCYVS